MRVRFEQLEYTRADYELAMMVIDGAGRCATGQCSWWCRMTFAGRGSITCSSCRSATRTSTVRRSWCARAAMGRTRGFARWTRRRAATASTWWARRTNRSCGARRERTNPLLGLIRDIPMRFPTDYVPIDGALPGSACSASRRRTLRRRTRRATRRRAKATLTAKKLGVNQLWSGELEEDSIIQYTPFLREQLARGLQHGVASSFYNGDTTNAATGISTLTTRTRPTRSTTWPTTASGSTGW